MPPTPTPARTHHLLPTPAGRTHAVQQGRQGPLVLLLHGFPESWYAWRHPVAGARRRRLPRGGDRRPGYGRSSKPESVEAYRMLDLVADNVAVVEALGERSAVVVGHDWGATIAAVSALTRPDVFRAVGLLGVPYTPPGGPRPSEVFAGMGGEGPVRSSTSRTSSGRAEAEAEIEPGTCGAGSPASTRPCPPTPCPRRAPPTRTSSAPAAPCASASPAGVLPSWLGERDLDVHAGEFERTGLTGALNRYRNMDRDWADLAGYAGAPITQPSLFIGGARDASLAWLADAVKAYPETLPGLGGSHVLDGCGHFVQQERPDETNRI
ncbi:alpha/beta hydrolase [Streptomyces tricolor]|nr:alpha/beta hydrolase [Streptomyces tricolor]